MSLFEDVSSERTELCLLQVRDLFATSFPQKLKNGCSELCFRSDRFCPVYINSDDEA